MRQRRLEGYFISSKAPLTPSRCGFPHLPRSVRELIYGYAGLNRIFVDLNYSNLKIYPRGAYPETTDYRTLDTRGCYNLKKIDVVELDEAQEAGNEAVYNPNYGVPLWGRVYGVC